MKKNVLLRTNISICVVIVIGYLITAVISHRANWNIFEKDVEQVSTLTMESVAHQIDSNFTKPMNISLTMANDSLLKEFLEKENEYVGDETFIKTMQEYLNGYRGKYEYDSVFLVSTQTGRYYHFNGLDRVLMPDNPENDWYYSFLEAGEEYSLNIDNDEAAKNEITVFINARISDENGDIMGIVGVGFRLHTLQALFEEYEKEFGIEAYLINHDGMVEVATKKSGLESMDLFSESYYSHKKEDILGTMDGLHEFWYDGANGKSYLVSQYIPNLDWFLVIDRDTARLSRQLNQQILGSIITLTIVVIVVLLIITSIIREYNKQVIQLTIAREQKHQSAFKKATERMYENIYELDITHNRAASEAAEQYFESLGAPKGTTYDEFLKIVAEKQIKEEYRQGYIDMFSRENVLEVYSKGIEDLCYDFMISNDGDNYYWMRINTHIFTWHEDDSVRMLIYRQNIDDEKRREQSMVEKMNQDSLTELYNKAATQEKIRLMLENSGTVSAFYIFDIDDFKQVNDQFGHAVGDTILMEVARAIRGQFRDSDVVGRIGGDEFVAFMQMGDKTIAEKKAQRLVKALTIAVDTDRGVCHVGVSIGVAVSPDAGRTFEDLYRNADKALYEAKKIKKSSYVFRT